MTEQVTSYREAAIADGWQPKAGSDYRLLRDGFVMDARESCAWDCIHIWGPDGLAIKVPSIYDWIAIQAGTKRCQFCKAKNVETQRVGFAGRCCAKCLPAKRAEIETPGWWN